MSIKQISVFVENKPGALYGLTGVLAQNGVDLRALSLAETSEFGIVRIIVDNLYRATTVLKDAGYDLDETDVLVVSNGFHLTRARMLAERAGFGEISTLAAPTSHLPSRLKMYIREPLALVKSFVFDR